MNRDLIFGPVLVQVLLTLATYVLLIKAKIRAMRAGEVDMVRRALFDDAWPESVMKINNNIRNQFEVPVLFYVLAFALWALHAVHWAALAAAWLFAISRIVHAWVHIGTNYVPNRRRAFTVGWWIVFAMALLVAWELGKRLVGGGQA
ncbi:MAG: MAPEG family protein [Steroidobacteraceae bacterium]